MRPFRSSSRAIAASASPASLVVDVLPAARCALTASRLVVDAFERVGRVLGVGVVQLEQHVLGVFDQRRDARARAGAAGGTPARPRRGSRTARRLRVVVRMKATRTVRGVSSSSIRKSRADVQLAVVFLVEAGRFLDVLVDRVFGDRQAEVLRRSSAFPRRVGASRSTQIGWNVRQLLERSRSLPGTSRPLASVKTLSMAHSRGCCGGWRGVGRFQVPGQRRVRGELKAAEAERFPCEVSGCSEARLCHRPPALSCAASGWTSSKVAAMQQRCDTRTQPARPSAWRPCSPSSTTSSARRSSTASAPHWARRRKTSGRCWSSPAPAPARPARWRTAWRTWSLAAPTRSASCC